jgi:hypothetical protein
MTQWRQMSAPSKFHSRFDAVNLAPKEGRFLRGQPGLTVLGLLALVLLENAYGEEPANQAPEEPLSDP